MNYKIFNKSLKQIVALLVSILLLINCTTTKQIVTDEQETILTSETIVLHCGDRTFFYYKVKSEEKGLIGLVTPTEFINDYFNRNRSDQLHIFLNSDIDIPTSFPAELTITQSAIKKIEIYESNPLGTILLVSLVIVVLVGGALSTADWGGPNLRF